jgi:hypothetical protein
MPSPTYQQFSATRTLVAATPLAIDIPINGCTNWTVIVRNTGATNAVTAATIAVSALGTLFSAAAAITTGIPLAAVTSLDTIVGSVQPCLTARLTLTSASGTTVSIEMVGS